MPKIYNIHILYIYIFIYIYIRIYFNDLPFMIWSSLLFFYFYCCFLNRCLSFFFFRTIIVYSFHCGHARQAWTDHSAALTAASVARYAMYLLAQPFSQETLLIIYEIFWNIYDPYSWFHSVIASFENFYSLKFLHRCCPVNFRLFLLFTLYTGSGNILKKWKDIIINLLLINIC